MDDLPTPPLPEETARTLARGGTVVLGAVSPRLPPSPSHQRCLLLASHLARLDLHRAHTGQCADPPRYLRFDLPSQRTRRCRERNPHYDHAVGFELHVIDHLELDDVVAQLRVYHGAQSLPHQRHIEQSVSAGVSVEGGFAGRGEMLHSNSVRRSATVDGPLVILEAVLCSMVMCTRLRGRKSSPGRPLAGAEGRMPRKAATR